MKTDYLEIDKEGNLKKSKKDLLRNEKIDSPKFHNLEAMNVGYYVVIPILIGIFLGLYLDSRFRTKPTFTLILILLGSVASFYNLYRLTKK